jgi:DNA topoisomerase-1
MNIGFTASMEDDLEQVAENKKNWKQLIKDFWTEFVPTLELAEKEGFVPKILTDIDCPTCGKKLQKVWFKNKYFYGCSGYPECTFSSPIEEVHFNKDEYAEDFDWTQKCPKCQGEMKLRHGKFGPFLGCLNYPTCKGIVNIPKKGEVALDQSDMPPCPAVGCDGHMVARRSRFGKIFYSCSTYPACDVIINELEKLEEKYPNHPRTPYVKVAKAKGRGRFASKGKAKATPETEGEEKAPKKAKAPAKRVTKPKATATKEKVTKPKAAATKAKVTKKKAPAKKKTAE